MGVGAVISIVGYIAAVVVVGEQKCSNGLDMLFLNWKGKMANLIDMFLQNNESIWKGPIRIFC